MSSAIEKINQFFHLPISFNPLKMELSKTIVSDLELIETQDSSCNSMFHYTFQPKSCFGKKMVREFSNYYTTDVSFLKDSQKLLKTYAKFESTVVPSDYAVILDIWDEIKNDTGFREKYHYIDWDYWEYLNHSEQFLQVMSLYNLAAPVLSLMVPFIILIIPFFVIKMKGLDITMSEYTEILKVIASQHAIGKLFTQFNDVKLDEKAYLVMSAAFYVFSVYQNMLTCLRFHKNMIKIHQHLTDIRLYIEHTEKTMYNFLLYSTSLKTYKQFNAEMKKHLFILTEFKQKLSTIHPYEFSIGKIGELGIVLKNFYDIYSNNEYNNSFLYSFGFHGYIDSIEGLQQNILDKHIHFTKFVKKTKKSAIQNFYYPALLGENPVKNSYSFKKNMIITGPNASGKTTILKTTLINIILSQQMGCGFYDETTTISPFKYIHCYLNIPDTSGRDSLFQAEARRCKNILDMVQENCDKTDTHFCAFDELYSGTNPDEAVMSAYAFITYLMKYKRVHYILTTHFIDFCNKIDSSDQVNNSHMEIKATVEGFNYTYELKQGISTVRGGFKVLEDMNYPKEIITNTNSL